MGADRKKMHFDVHPSVVFQLGSELVSDDIQALIELVKNSYDARATYAKVVIDTEASAAEAYPETMYPDAKGYVMITDDGEGMDLGEIRQGWMVMANSPKRKIKINLSENIDANTRTPLGDKGLGRLGSQLLGDNIEVITAKKDSKTERHVGFSWKDFKTYEALGDVPVQDNRRASHRDGTKVLISDLTRSERWKETEIKTELEDRLVELISPFEKPEGFDLLISVNNIQLDLAEITKKLRREADVSFQVDFDGDKIKITSLVKLRYLKPGGARSPTFARLCEVDDGARLLSHLQAHKRCKEFSIKRAQPRAWFLQCSRGRDLKDIDKADPAYSPGSFRAEMDSFSLDLKSTKEQRGFVPQDYKRHVKKLSGVRVYRDGFGVRVDRDFLQLGRQTTRGKSWYGLRPGNTIGFVSISASDNACLIETTDREGFKDTPHHTQFMFILQYVVGFTSDLLGFLRRETISYCDTFTKNQADISPGASPEELVAQIGKDLNESGKLGDSLRDNRNRLDRAARDLESSSKQAHLFRNEQANEALSNIQNDVKRSRESLDDAQAILDRLGKSSQRYEVVKSYIDNIDERLDRAHEAIGLGLSAEALAHEIRHIVDGLSQRTKEMKRKIGGEQVDLESTRRFVRHVNSTISTLRKQLSHLDPSLKYAREQREEIDIYAFLKEIKEYHESRWRDRLPIHVSIERHVRAPFVVKINRGKLIQIMDNLILNSEYWLKEDVRLKSIETGEILLEIRPPHIWLSDNGRGIDISVEDSLFEPFITRKKEGRGLGLFVVHEFLSSEGCVIGMHPDRNKNDRLFTFHMDLSGVSIDGKA